MTRLALLCRRRAEWGGREYAGSVARAVRPLCEAALVWEHGAAEPTATTLGRRRSNPWDTLILLDGPERAVNTGKLRARRIEAAEILWLSVDSRVTRWG
ncbi:MAG: hypothetical protein VCC04_08360 [Myxococcota bacterium]